MTREEFFTTYDSLAIESHDDFEMTLLSNLSDLQSINGDQKVNTHINAIKLFIMDFYSAQPKGQLINFNV
jgi:hypothetical protein